MSLRYITNNSIDVLSSKAETPELLFAEQRLLLMCAREMFLEALPFMDAIWSPIHSRFIKHDEILGIWEFPKIEKQPLFSHAWFYKRHIESEPITRHNYCCSIVKAILVEFPHIIELLKNSSFIERYIEE